MSKVLAVALDKEFQHDLVRLIAVGLAYATIAGALLAAFYGMSLFAYALD